MSQIIINGQPLYQVDLPEMTMAQWLALPVAERPKEWIRTDAEYTDIPAENVSYDNTSSGLIANNAQDAIDELSDIENITVTYPSIYDDTSNIKCFKCGKFVTISFVGAKLNTSVGQYATLLQDVPTPAKGAYVCNAFYVVSGGVTLISIFIDSNATILRINGSANSGNELYGSITYLTE